MSKQYGLIDPKAGKSAKLGLAKHAAFDSDSDSDGEKTVNLDLGESQKRQARAAQQKALAEDPTIYQYDELYDDMDSKRKEAKVDKSKEERKPKYITKLLETAEKRKLDQERRIERQVQKEREEEGEMFKDKESFVTSAYRAKLEEMKKAEEEEKREEYLESIGDVTKQGDLGGFYRHIYSQKVGESSEKKEDKKNIKQEPADAVDAKRENKPSKGRKRSESTSSESKEPAKKEVPHIKETGLPKSRRYRKRRSDDEENNEVEKNDSSKKVHLQSNLDADSDFSIDSNSSSSSSESGSSDSEKGSRKKKQSSVEPSLENKVKEEDIKELSNGVANVEKIKDTNGTDVVKTEDKIKEKKEAKKKEPKIDIWKKRTVGDAFDAALQRYYERKSARESG